MLVKTLLTVNNPVLAAAGAAPTPKGKQEKCEGTETVASCTNRWTSPLSDVRIARLHKGFPGPMLVLRVIPIMAARHPSKRTTKSQVLPEEEQFLRVIDGQPGDRSVRLAYADWLEERGDSRSELVRIEEEMRTIPIFSDQYWQLKPRRAQLRKTLDPVWLKRMNYQQATTACDWSQI
jgi:uncharacterized protein (TIGR02996 family)